MEMTLRTFSVLVDDEPGVLSQISRLFSRKGFNIESLAVGPTEEHGLSRLTLEVLTDDQQTELLCNQLSKMVPVHSVRLLAEEHSIRREMVLCKVRAEERSVRSAVSYTHLQGVRCGNRRTPCSNCGQPPEGCVGIGRNERGEKRSAAEERRGA